MIVKSQAVELLGWRSVKQCHHIRDYTHPERSYFNDFLSFIVFCSFWSSSNSCTSWLKFFIGWPSNTSSFQYCFFRLDASNLCLLVSASGRPWHILCTQVAISKLLAMTWELCFIYVFRPNRSPFNFSTTLKVLLCFPVLALHPVAQPWSRILQNLSFIPQQSFSVLIILLYVSHCDCWWTILRFWW